MLQQLKLVFSWYYRVAIASWEPLTRLAFLRDLRIEDHFDPLKVSVFDHVQHGLLPPLDLDDFPAMQRFYGTHCAGVKGHVRGAYLKIG